MRLGLVEGDVGFVDFVVEVVFENAAWVGRVPFLGDELDLFEDGFLVCLDGGGGRLVFLGVFAWMGE